MKKRSKILLNFLFLAFILGYIFLFYPFEKALKKAPSFSCLAPEGRINLPKEGKWWVFYIWSSHLANPQGKLKEIEKFWRQRPDGVEIMAVGVDVAPSFVFNFHMPVCYIPNAEEKKFVRDYDLSFLPAFLVIDERGRLRQKFFGTDWMSVKRHIEIALRLKGR